MTKAISEQFTEKVVPSKLLPDLEFLLYSTPEKLQDFWNQASGSCPWLKKEWLQVFAKAGGPKTFYLCFLRGGKPLGVSLLQVLPVVNMKLGPKVKPVVASVFFGGDVLQFGQALFSGPGGHHFADINESATLLSAASVELGIAKTSCWLTKDLPAAQHLPGWLKLDVLPELVLSIDEEWSDPADYYAAMKSKYRRRVYRARRKFEGLHYQHFDVEMATKYSKAIDELYANLIVSSSYVPYEAPPGYISKLKLGKPENVYLLGYFNKEKLIGFSTLLVDGDQGIAHFAAIDKCYNESHQLYLNLLLDLVELSIKQGISVLNFGRTATTIKTSIGAVPVEQHSFAKHDGCLRNQLLSILNERVLAGEPDAQVQHPFG